MMSLEMIIFFLIALMLFLMQAIGGIFQISDYKKTIRRLHKLGNLGIGQKKGSLFNGYIVIIVCDKNQYITECEVLNGKTFLAKFHKQQTIDQFKIIGKHIIDLQAELRLADEKGKKYKGYLQALDALISHFDCEFNQSKQMLTEYQL